MRFELVIFDCDGVLVDSEPIAARVFARHLARAGVAMEAAEVDERFRGRSMKRCLEIAEELRGAPLPEAFEADLEAETFEEFRAGLAPVEGVAAVVDAMGVPFCVASSGAHRKMTLTLGITGLRERFDGRIFSATEVARGKPFPDLFLMAAERMGAAPGRCAVIEDSVPGVEAGIAAGMTVFGYAERSDPERLASAGARVFRSMRELPALLAG